MLSTTTASRSTGTSPNTSAVTAVSISPNTGTAVPSAQNSTARVVTPGRPARRGGWPCSTRAAVCRKIRSLSK